MKADFQDTHLSAKNELRDTRELIKENCRSFTQYEPMSDKALAGNAAAAGIGTLFVVESARQLLPLFKEKAALVAEKQQASEDVQWVSDIKIGAANREIGSEATALLLFSLLTAAFFNRVRLQILHRLRESKGNGAAGNDAGTASSSKS